MVRAPTLGAGESSVKHEGWLAKRSSGTVSARWQKRFFVLEGSRLRYLTDPSAVPKRSFDMRFARAMTLNDRVPTEFSLDFGFRVWRLRAQTPEEARRWLLMLEAGRLVEGPAKNEDAGDASTEDTWSDDASCSSTSTVESKVSREAPEALTPRFGQTVAGFLTGTPGPLADQLEVDPQELDHRFNEWLGESLSPSNTQRIVDGLQKALDGLWTAFGSCAGTHFKHKGAAFAFESLKANVNGLGEGQVGGLVEAVDGLLVEYFLRFRHNLGKWARNRQPAAWELAEVVEWLAFEVEPAVEWFELRVAELAGDSHPRSWRDIVSGLEQFLLGEWEERRCFEVFRSCQEMYQTEASAEAMEELHAGPVRAQSAVELLEAALDHCKRWAAHKSMEERASSVLIATLNAILRNFRSATQSSRAAKGSARWSPSLGKALVVLWDRSAPSAVCSSEAAGEPSSEGPVAALLEALQLRDFCAATATASSTDLCAAFAAAFHAEATVLSQVVAANFKVPSPRRCWAELESACDHAQQFTDSSLPEGATAAHQQLRIALALLLVQRWGQHFGQLASKSSWSTEELRAKVARDEALLLQLVGGEGTTQPLTAAWAAQALSPVRTVAAAVAEPFTQEKLQDVAKSLGGGA